MNQALFEEFTKKESQYDLYNKRRQNLLRETRPLLKTKIQGLSRIPIL